MMSGLPPPLEEAPLRAAVRTALRARAPRTLVVLDDDPTGTQTVHDVPVLTTWEVNTLRREFAESPDGFFVLTNSRSLPPTEAGARIRDIARNLATAAPRESFTIVSRGDSTLRGHFPLETDVLAEELGPYDVTLVVPYFQAGRRMTVHDVHYVGEGDRFTPVAETPFARDPSFGFRASNLRTWVEEKSGGRIRREEVASFSIAELRTPDWDDGDADPLAARLRALPRGATAVVNACHPSDLARFVLAALRAELAGGRYLFRTAADFVATRLGLEPRGLWQPAIECTSARGGLVIVGSHVPKTTGQLQHLLWVGDVIALEASVPELLSPRGPALVAALAALIDTGVAAGRNVVLSTSRTLVTGRDAAESLAVAGRVSAALVDVVRRITVAPRWIIAKGGITSSDVATAGLGVQRATVRGALLPGVPVWELGAEARFPHLPYVVFPGNVGGATALHDALQRLAPAPAAHESISSPLP
ncbi:MAG: hypothetical protein HZA93_26635 [Verrucomicrobia bacterium]|nr:hypothetical protein [Verrucomicrobiota bacterium]